MRDSAGEVSYVGKAKNLCQRLRSYRVANPERVPQRHLRKMREVTWIDFDRRKMAGNTSGPHETLVLQGFLKHPGGV
jgi:excinuclease UvrABC nuclease subunit